MNDQDQEIENETEEKEEIMKNVDGVFETDLTPEKVPLISLNKRALVNFKKTFYQCEKIDQYQYASVHYDPEQKIVTFQFSQQKQKANSYKILHRKNSGLIFAHSLYRDHAQEIHIGASYQVESNRFKNNRKYYTIQL